MYTYAIIKGGTCVGISQHSEPLIEPGENMVGVMLVEGMNYVGRQYVDGVWGDAASAPPEPRHITVGAFFDRFGPRKWAILADESPQVSAIVRDASVRTYIDLDNPDLPAGLALLQAAGHDIDAQAVIDAPVLPQERP